LVNLAKKAELNFLTMSWYNLNGIGFVDNYGCPTDINFYYRDWSWNLQSDWSTWSILFYDTESKIWTCDFLKSGTWTLYFDTWSWIFNSGSYYWENFSIAYDLSYYTWTFNSWNNVLSFANWNLQPDWIDDNFDDDNFSGTSSWNLYPNWYFDDDIVPNLTIFSIIPWTGSYNIFWNNKELRDFISGSLLNENSGSLAELWQTYNWTLVLSWNILDKNIKIVRFDRNMYENEWVLIPTETKTWSINLQSLDFVNNDFAIFVENENQTTTLTWFDENWKKLYLNAINYNSWILQTFVNHIAIDENGRFFGENRVFEK
jgi:hypothetical protein